MISLKVYIVMMSKGRYTHQNCQSTGVNVLGCGHISHLKWKLLMLNFIFKIILSTAYTDQTI